MRSLLARSLLVLALAATSCQDKNSSKQPGQAPAAEARGKARSAPARAAAAPVKDWCKGHGVPESKCTICNPSLVAGYKASGDWCAEHQLPESICPRCNPKAAAEPAAEAGDDESAVRLASVAMEEAAGIQTVKARLASAAPRVQCTARVSFNRDRVAEVRSAIPGIVRRVRVALGADVKKGAALFDLESTRAGEAQGALQRAVARVRTATANLQRQRGLRAEGIAAARTVELAEQELARARARARQARATLRGAGAQAAAPTGRVTLRAPLSGTVVRRPAVVGVLATEELALATIADRSVMWVMCDVPEAAAARIAVGQKAQVSVDGSGDSAREGKVSWVAAEVNPRTRAVAARIVVPNDDGALRANQFARAVIEAGAPREAVSVPRASVQRVEDQEVVFVRTAPGVFSPKVVQRTGSGEVVQVEGEVSAGDEVVTTGAVLLRTEMVPGSIGAGCCDVEEPGGG